MAEQGTAQQPRVCDEPYIRATALIGTEEHAAREGLDMKALMREVGLPEEALLNPEMLISHRRVTLMMEIAASRLEMPSLGLEWMLRTKPHFANLGPMALLRHFVRNVEELAEMALRYGSYHTNAFRFAIRRDEENGLLRCTIVGADFVIAARQFAETSFASLVEFVRLGSSRPELSPVHVRFQHSAPPDTTLHKGIFRCPVIFNCDECEVAFDIGILKLPTAAGLRPFRPLLNYHMTRRMAVMPHYDQSAASTAKLAIPSVLGAGQCSVDLVAEAMGLSGKQLQRQLNKEGLTFSDILDDVRQTLARQMLLESEAPVARVAGLLDYSSNAAFTLAFRRWTGLSPRRFRKTERARLGLCATWSSDPANANRVKSSSVMPPRGAQPD